MPIFRVVMGVAPYAVNDPPSHHEETHVVRCDLADLDALMKRVYARRDASAHIQLVEYLSHELVDGDTKKAPR